MDIIKMSNKHIDECVDLFIDVFTKAPWNDTYSSRKQYYIDQFCVKSELQGKGIGSYFLKLIEHEIRAEKMNAIILNTESGFPAENFYLKSGFNNLKPDRKVI